MSVVKPNVTELLDHADSRYTLVVEASRRGRELIAGEHQPLVPPEGKKPLEISVEEIDRGLITYESAATEEVLGE